MANNESNRISYGGDMMIFISTGSTNYPIAFSNNATLERNRDTIEVSNKDSDGNKEYIYGDKSWSMTSDALYSYVLLSGNTRNSYDELFTMMESNTPVNVSFARKTGTNPNWTVDSTYKTYTGTALIASLPLTAPNNDLASFSIKLQGTGALTQS